MYTLLSGEQLSPAHAEWCVHTQPPLLEIEATLFLATHVDDIDALTLVASVLESDSISDAAMTTCLDIATEQSLVDMIECLLALADATFVMRHIPSLLESAVKHDCISLVMLYLETVDMAKLPSSSPSSVSVARLLLSQPLLDVTSKRFQALIHRYIRSALQQNNIPLAEVAMAHADPHVSVVGYSTWRTLLDIIRDAMLNDNVDVVSFCFSHTTELRLDLGMKSNNKVYELLVDAIKQGVSNTMVKAIARSSRQVGALLDRAIQDVSVFLHAL